MQFYPQAAAQFDADKKVNREQYLADWSSFVQLYNFELRMFRVRAYNNAAQSIPTGAATALTFNTNQYSVPQVGETGAMHSVSANTDRFTAPVAGHYLFSGQVQWAADVTGTFRLLQVSTNGAFVVPEIRDSRTPAAGVGGSVINFVTSPMELAYGDIVRLVASHNGAGAILTAPDYTWGALTLLCRLL